MAKSDKTNWRARPLSACVLASLVLLAGLSRAWGRSGPGDAVQIEKGSALAVRVEKAKKARVFTPAGELTLVRPVILPEGIVSSDPVGGYDRSAAIPWNDVRTIRLRKNAAGTGALVGAGAGALLVLAISLAPEMDGNAGTGMLFGGLAGLAAGTALGSMISSWKTVYTAPAAARAIPRISLMPTRAGGMRINVSLSF